MMHEHFIHAAASLPCGGNDRLAAGPWDHPTRIGHLGCSSLPQCWTINPGLTASGMKRSFAASR